MTSREAQAREFFEANRWPNGPVCPHCESKVVCKLTPKEGSKSPVRPGVYKCRGCRQQFTARIGTIFEECKVPLGKCIFAVHLMTSSKKGISSHQLARELGITQKSAWFLGHRVREAMKQQPLAGLLQGVVEVDETYVGGNPRRGDGKDHKRGNGSPKAPVLVLVQRDCGARCKPIQTVDSKTLQNETAVNVTKGATVMTDELFAYRGIRDDDSHRAVKHGAREYSRIDPDGINVHTNTAESFFSLLKRGHYGILHNLSKKHLWRYCNEFGFRWTCRKVTDGERMVAALGGIQGKRLMYHEAAS
jgi:transposase-like protein